MTGLLYLQNSSGYNDCYFKTESLVDFLYRTLFIDKGSYLGVSFITAAEMRDLKIKHFGVNEDSDVLSFPIDEIAPGSENSLVYGVLGDIVVCPETVMRQAVRHPFEHEIYLLVVHGFLHLLGFDHSDAPSKKEMFSLQAKLIEDFFALENLGTPSGEITITPDLRPSLGRI